MLFRSYRILLEKFPFLSGRIREASSYLDEMAVTSSQRKKGIAKMLGKNFEEIARQQRIPEIVLRTDERNKASMALFKSLGFDMLGIRDPQYTNRQYLSKKL